MRRIRFVLLIAALAVILAAVFAVRLPERDPARDALAAHLEEPERSDCGYPRLGLVMRSRAWVLSGPFQPDGIAAFTRLPDAEFGPERRIAEREIRPATALIAGRTWNEEARGWRGADGSLVPLGQVQDLLETTCPTPADARLIIDLILGPPPPGVPPIGRRMAQGDLPGMIRIRPFQGVRGALMLDTGKPPYVPVERRYAGCLLACDGPGWPGTWRVARLDALGQ